MGLIIARWSSRQDIVGFAGAGLLTRIASQDCQHRVLFRLEKRISYQSPNDKTKSKEAMIGNLDGKGSVSGEPGPKYELDTMSSPDQAGLRQVWRDAARTT